MVGTGLVVVLAIPLSCLTAHGFRKLDPGEAGRAVSVADGETITFTHVFVTGDDGRLRVQGRLVEACSARHAQYVTNRLPHFAG